MSGYEDAFSLLAELAIALAGFSGVAAAFAGRERSYRPTERIRVLAIFLSSGVVLAGAGAVLTLSIAASSPSTIFRAVSACAAFCVAVAASRLSIQAYRVAREPDSTSEAWALNLSVSHWALALLLLGANSFVGSAALLTGTFWLLLLFGLWMFSRLLTRSN